VVILALVGLIWIKPGDGLTKFGWVMLISGALVYISTSVIKEKETRRVEKELHKRIDGLFKTIANQVMEAPKEVSPPPRPEPTGQVQITSPLDKSQVHERTFIEGTVSDPQAKVWVILHPLELSDYWVQPAVTVRKDGTWRVNAYLGRPGNIDVGKQFELMVIAKPEEPLKEGDVLMSWPEAQAKSQVIEVTRQ